MVLRARNDIHLARRLWHFLGVMVIYFLYQRIPPENARSAALVLSLPMVAIDVTRLFVPPLNKAMMVLFKPFMRESEKHRLAGITFMLVGVTINIILLPRVVVPLTLLFLAVADPLASFVGIRYGKDKLVGNKSLQGSFAAFVACFVLSCVYLSVMDLMHERLFIVCLLAGLIGAVSELMPVGKLDDNFVFPVMSGILLTGLFSIFGGI
jgi:diacylglycerol kinase (CTP)